jgi:hypothetical protein
VPSPPTPSTHDSRRCLGRSLWPGCSSRLVADSGNHQTIEYGFLAPTLRLETHQAVSWRGHGVDRTLLPAAAAQGRASALPDQPQRRTVIRRRRSTKTSAFIVGNSRHGGRPGPELPPTSPHLTSGIQSPQHPRHVTHAGRSHRGMTGRCCTRRAERRATYRVVCRPSRCHLRVARFRTVLWRELTGRGGAAGPAGRDGRGVDGASPEATLQETQRFGHRRRQLA